MADTWQIAPRLRPEARDVPEAEARLRPRLRPEALAGDAPQAVADAGPLRPQPRPEGLGTIPDEAQHAATVAEALPLDETTLIGLFNGPDGGTALLRLSGGSIVRVAAGGDVDGGRVTAIDEDGVRLQRGDRQVLLTIPG